MYLLVLKFRFLEFRLLLSRVAPYYSSLPRTVLFMFCWGRPLDIGSKHSIKYRVPLYCEKNSLLFFMFIMERQCGLIHYLSISYLQTLDGVPYFTITISFRTLHITSHVLSIFKKIEFFLWRHLCSVIQFFSMVSRCNLSDS